MRTLAALLLGTTAAVAQFKPAHEPHEPNQGYGPYECAITSVRPKENNDPVYKIVVLVATADSDNRVTGVTPIHHTRSGQTYDRTQQYLGQFEDKNPHGMPRIEWTGVRNGMQMVGTLNILNAGGGSRALYNEVLYQNGRKVMSMESVCHAVAELLE
jgi:ABC-type glycerol-3-phosphate transport system substrate-binding protein